VRGELAKTSEATREGKEAASAGMVMHESFFPADADTESESRFNRFFPYLSLSLPSGSHSLSLKR
jgi:hypothetical protein